jgi:cystine transport system permease protein
MTMGELAAQLLPAGAVNILLTLIAFPGALVVAFLVAAIRISRVPLLGTLAAVYVDVIRMTPLLLHLFFVFYALPFVGLTIDAWPAAALTFAFGAGAYQSEAVRAAYLSVPPQLVEASEVLGMTHLTRLRRVMLPIAIRIAIPPLANTLVEMFRATSFVALLALPDIVFTGLLLINRYHRPAETLLLVAAFFITIGYPAGLLIRRLERRVAIP